LAGDGEDLQLQRPPSPPPSLMVRRKEKMRNYEDLLKDEVSFFWQNFVRLFDARDASLGRSIN